MKMPNSKNSSFKILVVRNKKISSISIVGELTKTSLPNSELIGKKYGLLSIFRRNANEVLDTDILKTFDSKSCKSGNVEMFESNFHIMNKQKVFKLLIENIDLITKAVNSLPKIESIDPNQTMDMGFRGYTMAPIKSFGKTVIPS